MSAITRATPAAPVKGSYVTREVAFEAIPLIAAIVLVPAAAFRVLYEVLLEASVALAVLCGLIGIGLMMVCLLAFMCSGIGWWLAGERWAGGLLFAGRGLLTLMTYEMAWRSSLYGDDIPAFGFMLALAAATAIVSPALLAFLKRQRDPAQPGQT